MSNPALKRSLEQMAPLIDGHINGATAGTDKPVFGFVLIGQSFREQPHDAQVASNMSHKEKARLFKALAEIEERMAEDE